MEMKLRIDKACPQCHKQQAVVLDQAQFWCEACDFSTRYCCPVCQTALPESCFASDAKGAYFLCPTCQNTVYLKKLKFLIENGLIVDYQQRCVYCNSPTIRRREVTLGNRCFFYPQCVGQIDLFGQTRESLIFIDFETTGLNVMRDHIIEIGAIKIDEEGYELPFQTFIKPPQGLSARITEITGITEEMLQYASDWKVGLEKLMALIGTSKIVVHHAEFDIPWLIKGLTQFDLPLPSNEVICTLQWARACQEPRASLAALTKKYKISHPTAHRALADAAATKELFFIYENIKSVPRPVSRITDYQLQR